jgi:diguanylate cyclase (GGDEF)-like protein
LGFGLFHNDKKISHFVLSTLFTLIPVYLWISIGFREGVSPSILGANKIVCFSAASLILTHAIYLMYWQRVYVDELTSLPNRRALDERINTLEGQYSIAMIDIDHFKKFNDSYGHDQGDDVLRLVSRVLESALGDKVYRYGGEEFAAIFQGVSAKDAKAEAEQARSNLAKIRFIIRTQKGKDRKVENRGKVKGAKSVKVTISIGLSNFSKHADCPEKVIKRADSALYKAKKNGRNCVVIAA